MVPGEPDLNEWFAQLTRRPEWHSLAACRGAGPSAFFPSRGATTARARAVCSTCPVTEECLTYAMADIDTTGIWGGTSARQRRAMRAETALLAA